MSQKYRIILAIVGIFVVIVAVLGVDLIRRQQQEQTAPEIPPGAIDRGTPGKAIFCSWSDPSSTSR